jgi:predicted transport protein
MPLPSWKPLPEEADLFCDVFIDESSQTKHRYLVLGGLVIPISHTGQFEADIIGARKSTILPATEPDGTIHVLKWQKANAYNLQVYKKVVDTVFHFRRLCNMPVRKEMGMHCVVVDTSIKTLRDTGDGDIEIGFDKEFYFLCVVVIPKRYRVQLFLLYPDRRDTRRPPSEARDIMNRGAYKWGDKRKGPIRGLEFADPENSQALQVVDILIGALAFRLNRHYDAPKANPAKKNLCDYIWELFKLPDPFNTSPYQQKRFMTWVHRPMPADSPKSGPQNWRE